MKMKSNLAFNPLMRAIELTAAFHHETIYFWGNNDYDKIFNNAARREQFATSDYQTAYVHDERVKAARAVRHFRHRQAGRCSHDACPVCDGTI